MHIGVACRTLSRQSEKGPVGIDIVMRRQKTVVYKGLLVTVPARRLAVLALERKTGLVMVKFISTVWPVDQIKSATRMVAVTGETCLPFQIHHTVVIPALCLQAVCDLGMALKAFVRAGTRAEVMT